MEAVIRTDSELTSGVILFDDEFRSNEEMSRSHRNTIELVQVFEDRIHTIFQGVLLSSQTGRPHSFRSNLYLLAPTFEVKLTSFKNVMDYWATRQMSHPGRIAPDLIARGPSPDTWTLSYISIIREETIQDQIQRSLGELDRIIEGIKNLSIERRSEEFESLAWRAAEESSAREDEDIEEWARRLAKDVAGAND